MHFRDYVPAFICILVACAALYFLLPAYTHYRESRMTVNKLEQSLGEQRMEIQRLRKEITDLKHDYRAIERVAREKWGLCRDNETIYHFDPPADVRE